MGQGQRLVRRSGAAETSFPTTRTPSEGGGIPFNAPPSGHIWHVTHPHPDGYYYAEAFVVDGYFGFAPTDMGDDTFKSFAMINGRLFTKEHDERDRHDGVRANEALWSAVWPPANQNVSDTDPSGAWDVPYASFPGTWREAHTLDSNGECFMVLWTDDDGSSLDRNLSRTFDGVTWTHNTAFSQWAVDGFYWNNVRWTGDRWVVWGDRDGIWIESYDNGATWSAERSLTGTPRFSSAVTGGSGFLAFVNAILNSNSEVFMWITTDDVNWHSFSADDLGRNEADMFAWFIVVLKGRIFLVWEESSNGGAFIFELNLSTFTWSQAGPPVESPYSFVRDAVSFGFPVDGVSRVAELNDLIWEFRLIDSEPALTYIEPHFGLSSYQTGPLAYGFVPPEEEA